LRLNDTHHRAVWEVAAIAFYAIASAIFLYPVLAGGLGSFCIGAPESNDPQIFIWGLAWYPSAISHRLDPLFTSLVFAPGGYNLAWSTTVPAPALLMWPITVRFGPLASFNLLSLLTPILSAYTAFALCRHVSRATLPALVGGFVYGFSTYQRIESDHLNLALTFVPPLLVLLFSLRLENRVGRSRYEFLLFVCLTFQFLISPEIFTTEILFGVVAIAASWWIGDVDFRLRRRSPLRESIVAIVVAVVALSPYIYRFIPSPFGTVSDLQSCALLERSARSYFPYRREPRRRHAVRASPQPQHQLRLRAHRLYGTAAGYRDLVGAQTPREILRRVPTRAVFGAAPRRNSRACTRPRRPHRRRRNRTVDLAPGTFISDR